MLAKLAGSTGTLNIGNVGAAGFVVSSTTSLSESEPLMFADATVALPESAEPGIYTYELQFESKPITFEKSLTFVVRAR